MTLNRWEERLEKQFEGLHKTRLSSVGDNHLFALEHGLSEDDRAALEREICAYIKTAEPSDRHWLAWVVYAAELGYRYEGAEYWQTFESRTPAGWPTATGISSVTPTISSTRYSAVPNPEGLGPNTSPSSAGPLRMPSFLRTFSGNWLKSFSRCAILSGANSSIRLSCWDGKSRPTVGEERSDFKISPKMPCFSDRSRPSGWILFLHCTTNVLPGCCPDGRLATLRPSLWDSCDPGRCRCNP